MLQDKILLRAENITDVEFLVTSPLLPSQKQASGYISDYIRSPELTGYSYYLTGPRGSGKTQTVLSTIAHESIVNTNLTASVVTFDPLRGTIMHPSFHQNLDDSDVIVFNDGHYDLEAIRDGRTNRQEGIDRWIKMSSIVKQNHAKSIVVTDTPLSVYANEIGDKRLEEVLHDSLFLTPNELFTGGYNDLSTISKTYVLNADDRLLWNIHHTRPNIRYFLGINYLYGNDVTDFVALTERLKQGIQNLKGKNGILLKILFDKPEIKGIEDVQEVAQKLNEKLSKPFNLPHYREIPRGLELNEALVGSINKIDSRLLKYRDIGLAYVPTEYSVFQEVRASSSYDSDDRHCWNYNREFIKSFVLGDPIYKMIIPRIHEEGIQIRSPIILSKR